MVHFAISPTVTEPDQVTPGLVENLLPRQSPSRPHRRTVTVSLGRRESPSDSLAELGGARWATSVQVTVAGVTELAVRGAR